MEVPRRPHPPDPEFDPAPIARVRLRDFDPAEHQRLVVNPFLAALGLIAGWLIAGRLLRGPFPPLAVLLVLPLPFLTYLVQYHCLDCGQTGPYPRRGRHACAGVVARWHGGARSRSPVPSARSQLVVWAYLLGSAALLILVSG